MTNKSNKAPALPGIPEDVYECIGVCMPEPLSGLCQGCGRPLAEPQVAAVPVRNGSGRTPSGSGKA